MQTSDSLPRDGKHFRSRIELHRAGTQRDHGCREREVFRFQATDVTQHLRLGVVGIEDGMREERRGALESGWNGFRRRFDSRGAEDFQEARDIAGGFVEW